MPADKLATSVLVSGNGIVAAAGDTEVGVASKLALAMDAFLLVVALILLLSVLTCCRLLPSDSDELLPCGPGLTGRRTLLEGSCVLPEPCGVHSLTPFG